MKQTEFKFTYDRPFSKQYNKRVIKGYRKDKQTLRDQDTYDQLLDPHYNE